MLRLGVVIVAGVGVIIVVTGGASVGCCIDISTYLVVVECSWVVRIVIVAGVLQMVIVSGTLMGW